jgi:hypothetical protein
VALRDLALTVLELEPNEYHWVLMEAMQAESEDCLGYKPVDSSTRGLSDYSEALIQGATALRVLQGLAPFGSPKSSVPVADDIGDEDEDEDARGIRHAGDGTNMARLPSSARCEMATEASHDTSMLTTIASRL